MNYSNLPVYIRKEDSVDALPFADIYDPDGIDNSLYMVNKSTAQNTSIQYLSGSFSRVSGNALNYEELFVPKINYTSPDVQILLPQFRSLVFYNLDGSRTIEPDSFPEALLPELYFSGYNSGSNTIDYMNTGLTPFAMKLKWSGSNDTYSLDYYDNYSPGPIQGIFYASGTGFSSGWKYYGTSAYTGVICSGLGVSASGILNAINDPTGTSFYYMFQNNDYYAPNSTSGSIPVNNILLANAVSGITGYVAPHTKLTLGKAYHYIPAQNVSVNYQAQNDALRMLGVNIDQNDQFTNGAALQAKISFNSYVNTETSGALNTVLDSSGDSFYSIIFGNNIYSSCYLSDYDISVEPFKPIGLNANYMVNNAPVLNSNNNEYIVIETPGSINYLLYSESLTGDNYNYISLEAPVTSQPDPFGGNMATYLVSSSSNSYYTNFSIDNSLNYTWATISGSGTELVSLKTNTDLSVGINFASSKTFEMGDSIYSKIWISNNGIFSFDSVDEGYSNYQNTNFPIDYSTKKLIAAYWRDMSAGTGGSIWYKQESDRFIIEYNAVNAINGAQPQTYQVHLIFATGEIEIRYENISASGVFNPNPNVGIQYGQYDSLNYNLSNIDTTKILKFIPSKIYFDSKGSIIYSGYTPPMQTRTFSIYLKRGSGTGLINYTTNGYDWSPLNPELTNVDWRRYEFPAVYGYDFTQQVGIQIETSGDSIYVYGAQLEPLSYATSYIPTLNQPVIGESSITNIPIDITASYDNLTTGFANTMINGNTCSISSTTGFTSNIQNSIRYSVNCGRSPIYNLGQINASRFVLDTVEKQMDISSTDLTSFINFSGSKLLSDLNLTLKDSQNVTGSIIAMKSGANIFSQQMNIQENETLTTQVSIKEIVV